MAKAKNKWKPTGEQCALCRQIGDGILMRIVDGNGNVTFQLQDGTAAHQTVAENCIKYGLIYGQGDGLFNGWHQTYRLTLDGIQASKK